MTEYQLGCAFGVYLTYQQVEKGLSLFYGPSPPGEIWFWACYDILNKVPPWHTL